MDTNSRARRRATTFRRIGWLAVAAMTTLALVGPAAGPALGAGPGNNGLDPTGNLTKSNATVGSSLPDAGGSATMGTAVMFCDGTNVGSLSGSFTLAKTLDVGSKITVYLAPNNGSNANPEANVAKNETTITFTSANNASGTVVPWSITITSPFTVSSGGILGVFAVNDDGVTAISSSKTNSLNCTEGTTTSSTTTGTTTTGTTTTGTTTTGTTTTGTTTTGTTTTGTTTTGTTTQSTTTGTTSTGTTQSTTTGTTTTGTTTTGTTTPDGGVLGATATPKPTPPPTDTQPANGTPSDSWRLALLAIAGLLATLLLLAPATPAKARRRR
jgi:hypothetical protein